MAHTTITECIFYKNPAFLIFVDGFKSATSYHRYLKPDKNDLLERKKERKNEWMNEWMNEWKKERMKERRK